MFKSLLNWVEDNQQASNGFINGMMCLAKLKIHLKLYKENKGDHFHSRGINMTVFTRIMKCTSMQLLLHLLLRHVQQKEQQCICLLCLHSSDTQEFICCLPPYNLFSFLRKQLRRNQFDFVLWMKWQSALISAQELKGSYMVHCFFFFFF